MPVSPLRAVGVQVCACACCQVSTHDRLPAGVQNGEGLCEGQAESVFQDWVHATFGRSSPLYGEKNYDMYEDLRQVRFRRHEREREGHVDGRVERGAQIGRGRSCPFSLCLVAKP